MAKDKRKFLKTIYSIQDNFGTDSGHVSRNFSFGLLPKDKQLELIDKWFNEVNHAKDLLYKEIYEDFKKIPNKYLDNSFDYKTFFGGRSIINYIRNNTEIITSQPVMEGLSMEITGSIRSFITNHGRIFSENQAELLEARNILKELKARGQKAVDVSHAIDLLTKRVKNLDSEKFGKKKRYEDRLLFYIFKVGEVTKEGVKQYLAV